MTGREGNMKNDKKTFYIVDLIIAVLLIAADQLTKLLAVGKLRGNEDYIVIDGVFRLHYLENRGAAFSMLEDARVLFILVTAVMLVAVFYLLAKVPAGRHYLVWHISLTMIAAGGVGNLIDRLRLSYVIDFLYFSLIDFPVFNVADVCVTVGVLLLVIWVVFVCKDEDLKFMESAGRRQKKKEETGQKDV